MTKFLLCLLMAIDVTQHGADPSGVADSTAAIQAAFDAAAFQNVTDPVTGYVLAQTAPTVRFPSGRYKVSGTLNPRPICTIEGEKAILNQTASVPTLVFAGATTLAVRGLRITGGTTAIAISNANIDSSTFFIDDCHFDRTTDAAITVRGTGTSGQLSGIMEVSRCRFRGCNQALSTYIDMCHLNDCWISWTQAAIVPPGTVLGCIDVKRGRLSVTDTMLVPADFTAIPTQHCWITSVGSVLAERSTFSGENGGIPIIRFGACPIDPNNSMGVVAHFTHCQLSAGRTQNTAAAIVTLDAGTPQQIVIEKCRHLFAVPYIVDVNGTGATTAAALPTPLQITIRNNTTWPRTMRVPEVLTQYLVP